MVLRMTIPRHIQCALATRVAPRALAAWVSARSRLPRELRLTPVVASSRAHSYANVICDPLACGISSVCDCATSLRTLSLCRTWV
ncbi:hypothetical protein PanWU01x14_074440 [Parasponia andersonii]|uniref:Uncharacterized protein n=1 Tax=Parasponia andersonii TaxID=3476 RepID=A0A2P5DDD6_PARAD|nr:hypothetical protein PanWU01x14_074440 [Parasponia andersonii]